MDKLSTRKATEAANFSQTVMTIEQNARTMAVLGQLDSAIFELALQSEDRIAAAIVKSENEAGYFSNTPEARLLHMLHIKTGLALDRMRQLQPAD